MSVNPSAGKHVPIDISQLQIVVRSEKARQLEGICRGRDLHPLADQWDETATASNIGQVAAFAAAGSAYAASRGGDNARVWTLIAAGSSALSAWSFRRAWLAASSAYTAINTKPYTISRNTLALMGFNSDPRKEAREQAEQLARLRQRDPQAIQPPAGHGFAPRSVHPSRLPAGSAHPSPSPVYGSWGADSPHHAGSRGGVWQAVSSSQLASSAAGAAGAGSGTPLSEEVPEYSVRNE